MDVSLLADTVTQMLAPALPGDLRRRHRDGAE
jgi:hypothetical protein